MVKVSKTKTPVNTSQASATPNNTQPSATETAAATPTATAEPTATPKATKTPKPTATVPAEYNPPSDYTKKKTDVTYGTRKTFTYDSKTTGVKRKAEIVLPAGYTEEKTYPVVYLLH